MAGEYARKLLMEPIVDEMDACAMFITKRSDAESLFLKALKKNQSVSA
jgi:hypothetical protein